MPVKTPKAGSFGSTRVELQKAYRPKSAAEIARNMGAIRSRENRVEKALRLALFGLGLRYRKYYRAVPGCPDIAFVRLKIAVFVDGDYWHGRQLRERGELVVRETLRTPRREYWIEKLGKTIQRDDRDAARLRILGWTVIRVWESDVKKDIVGTAELIAALVRGKGNKPANAKK